MVALFLSGHVGIERLPSVAQRRQPTGGGELPRDAASF
jgi:hypothetical protein